VTDGPRAESRAGRPHPLLRDYVERYTGYDMRGFPPGRHVGLPSRHLTFIVQFDAPLELAVLPGGRATPQRFEALVSGLHTSPAVIAHDGNQRGIQLHVTPAGARALFGMPAAELVDAAVPLDAVWGRVRAGELVERLDGAATWDERFAVLDRQLARAAAGRAEVPSPLRAETAEAMHRLVVARGDLDIAALASDVGWSRRHLTDQFGAEFGVTPKAMARVLRFERSKALFVRGAGATLATIAAECGYADQSHMAREWRSLAGASPTQWLADEQLPVVHDVRELVA
jgi:AraC-like DNA-binding protein